jgi:adenosine deaminase
VLRPEVIRDAPKALLHDHLDGGLRPATIIDLAAECGYDGLPTRDPDALAKWIRRGADRKSLELYLETFAHTVGVMQERDAIVRVAAECAEDLAADGVVYAEVRYAPELSTERGLSLDEVVAANLEGFKVGAERAAQAGRPIVMKMLVTAMRQAARSVEVAECAVRWRDAGVVGFDIAGPEEGYRPTRHLDAFDLVRRENFHITIHAGESFGLPSIWGRSSSAGRSVWATASGSSTTSPCTTTTGRWSSAASPPSCAIAACRSRCARPRTCIRARRRPSTPIRSTCCGASASG